MVPRGSPSPFDGTTGCEAAFTLEKELFSDPTTKPTCWSCITCHTTPYTLRRLGGRHPLWGMWVTSLMLVITSPTPCSERIAASLPAPGPLMNTSIWRRPWSMPRRAACSAARWAAKAVPLREPLKPTVPELADPITPPCGSVMVTKVLLKVE